MPTIARRTVVSLLAVVLTAAVLTGLPPASAPPAPLRAQAPAVAREAYTRIGQWPAKAADATSALREPVGLDIGPDDRVYISDAGVAGVHVVLPTGQFLPPFGATGPDRERLGAAGKLAVAPADGRVYVLDTASDRVVVYDLDGKYLADWGGIDGAAIAAGPDGRVFVADREANRVQAFDRDGNRLFAFGGLGTEDGRFTGFIDVSVSPDGKVLAVGDMLALRVQLFDLGPAGATFRRAYLLNAPKYSPPANGIPPFKQCRATVVHALGEDDVWVGDGTGACRLTPAGHTYTIGSTMADGTICKQTVRLPRVRPDTGQFAALATYDPNDGACYGTRRGKDTRLPTTPAVVRFRDDDLARVDTVWLSGQNSREDGGLVVPFVVSSGVLGQVFVQDRTRYSRYFGPDGAARGTVALTTRQGAGTNDRFTVLRADGADSAGEIYGYYLREHRGQVGGAEGRGTATPSASPTPGPARDGGGAGWVETEHGLGRFRNVQVREFGETVDVLEPVWTNPFAVMSPARTVSRQGPVDSLEVIDIAYNPAGAQLLALVFERLPKQRVDDARIELVPADGGRRTVKWDLPEDTTTSFAVNPYVDLSVGPDGRVYVLNDYADLAEVFAADGTPLGRIPLAPDVRQIAGGPGGVLFGLREAGYVERYAADGTVTARFDARPSASADPSTLSALAADAAGRVFVADGRSSQIAVFAPAAPGADVVPVPDDATCVLAGDKTASPTRLTLGETTEITLTVSGQCGIGEAPSDIMLTVIEYPPLRLRLDNGADDPAAPIIKELRRLVSRIDFAKHRVGIVAYFGDTEVQIPLTNDPAQVLAALQRIPRRWPGTCNGYPGYVYCVSYPRLRDALQVAQEQFEPSSPRRPVILLYQPDYCNRAFEYRDGDCRGYVPAEEQAEAIRAAGTQIMIFDGNRTGYRRLRFNGTPYNADAQPLASSDADTVFDYDQAQHRMVRYSVPEVLATDFKLTDTLPANMRLVAGSVTPPGTVGGADVLWTIARLPTLPDPFHLTIQPQAAGRWPTNVQAVASYTDGWGQPGQITFPIPEVEVIPPTATPTSTAIPTATRTPMPTATPTDRPSATPSPTRTPELRALYLPILLKDLCRPRDQHVEVALVVDVSSSMEGAKLAAAKAALGAFVGTVDLGPAKDRVALVAFDETARLVQPLSADRAALDAAIAGLATGTGTRIDHGLDLALDVLTGPDHRADSAPLVVLMSDGRQADIAPVAAAGNRARGLAIEVFTIGLGVDVDAALLAAVATDPRHYYFAPTADELAGIYGRIAREIPCR